MKRNRVAVVKDCAICSTPFGISSREDKAKRERIRTCRPKCGYELQSLEKRGKVSGRP